MASPGGIALICGVASWTGLLLFEGASVDLVAGITALAAGSVLAMIADAMIVRGFQVAHNFAGIITVLGFLAAFALSKLQPTMSISPLPMTERRKTWSAAQVQV